MAKIIRCYNDWLSKHPILTKSITSGVLFGVGDWMAQRIEQRKRKEKQPHDLHRTLRMMIWGGVLFAPVGHAWYNLLERRVAATGKIGIAKKILADQLIFTPPCTIAFFTSIKLMEGESTGPAVDSALKKLPDTLKVNYTVWPCIHVCTFGVIPLQYRILFINIMSLGWSVFLSLMSSGSVTLHDE